MTAITPVEFEFPGGDGQPLPGRIYRPSHAERAPAAVVIVEGYPDPGFVKHVGCRFMDMQWSISMAQLIAASGMAAITYANRQPAPDGVAVIDYVAANAARLGIAPLRPAIWATSGHGPVAMALLGRVSCAVLANPVTEPAPSGADGSGILAGVPIFVIRSGNDDTPQLNASLDRFIAGALAHNQPITVINHAEAPHAFDLYHDSATTRFVLRQALEFLRSRLHTSGG